MTNQDSLQLGQAISSRGSAPDLPMACGKTLHFGFFFDGFSRHLGEDLEENRVSNIGKLFLAHEQDDPNESASLLKTGVDTRLEGALSVFNREMVSSTGQCNILHLSRNPRCDRS